ncbi:hypothetical protein [Tenacibaculum caenipelagi]|uniref:Uncharacterized protein n=1 Tax=Tenacibaculum caenipelagi TaxID=1325435 RepID=A0A4R6TEK6_9FLAO|nr:hypothetical protein [Tenacibaculum caenipelagi]TDQ23733.1 hypothetical protein DFQ07_2261 [Tenacibaculum caenipelagi]
MRNKLLILIMIISCSSLFCQEAHLSYNFFGEKNIKTRTNKTVTFFIGENSFIYFKDKDCYKIISVQKNLKPEVLKINDFLNRAHQLKNINKEDNKIIVKKKNQIFQKIFLYEKRDDCIYVYCVKWEDSIID